VSELLSLLLSASPLGVISAVLCVILIAAVVVLAPVLKLEAKAWFLRRRGVGRRQLAAWALEEATKDRTNPLVEIINAIRRGRS
jgi:hypothetical protein